MKYKDCGVQAYYDHMRLWQGEYGLSARTAGGLYHMELYTIEDAANASDATLLRQYNFGRKSLVELRQFLAERRIVPVVKEKDNPPPDDSVLVLYLDEKLSAKLSHFAKVNGRTVTDEALALLHLAMREIRSMDKYLKPVL